MKINKIKIMVPAMALLLASGVSSCMGDLDDGNINGSNRSNNNNNNDD